MLDKFCHTRTNQLIVGINSVILRTNAVILSTNAVILCTHPVIFRAEMFFVLFVVV